MIAIDHCPTGPNSGPVNPDTESVEYLKARVREAVDDQLRSTAGKVDIRSASDVILNFVFRNVDAKTLAADHNRYEWYYSLLGKSIAIAQGWKVNHAGDIKESAQTGPSVQEYIKATYGVKI